MNFFLRANQYNGRKDPEFFDRVVNDAGLREIITEINATSPRAWHAEAADHVSDETGERRFVAGALGPCRNRVAVARRE